MAREFEQFQVGWFEEPVLADDIDGLAEIRAAIDIPVASGEHEYSRHGFRDLVARGGADILQPDVGRVGGVTEWMKVAHLADSFNRPVAPHAVQLVPSPRGVRHAQPEGRGVHEYLSGGGPRLVYRLSTAKGWHVVAVSGQARAGPRARPIRRREVGGVGSPDV